MASWNSVVLHVSYEVLGWFAFVCWSISFYPQVILNFCRKRYKYTNPENYQYFIIIIIIIINFPSKTFSSMISFVLVCFGIPLWYYYIYSVVGLNFDFVVLNLTKHTSYLIYNASLYFSSAIQNQYRDKYGQKQVCSFLFVCNYHTIHFNFLCMESAELVNQFVPSWIKIKKKGNFIFAS